MATLCLKLPRPRTAVPRPVRWRVPTGVWPCVDVAPLHILRLDGGACTLPRGVHSGTVGTDTSSRPGSCIADRCGQLKLTGQMCRAGAEVPEVVSRLNFLRLGQLGCVDTLAKNGCQPGSSDTAVSAWPSQQMPRCRGPRPPHPAPMRSSQMYGWPS